MARVAGRRGHVYIDQTAGASGAATPCSFLSKWSMEATFEQVEVTAFGDTTKTYISGLPDAKGSASGFFDDTSTTGSQALLAVATSGLARKTYLYPTTPSAAGPYFFGTAFWSTSYDVDVAGPSAISMTWAAATSFASVG